MDQSEALGQLQYGAGNHIQGQVPIAAMMDDNGGLLRHVSPQSFRM